MKSTLLGTCVLLLASACASTAVAPEEGKSLDCVFLQLKTGPRSESLSKEELGTVFSGHIANIERLADAGRLLVAGPYGAPKRDAALRGVMILATTDVEDAQALAATDPAVIAGVFRTESVRMRTRAPLEAYSEHELGIRARDKAEGRVRELGEGLRSYVWLTAEHGRRARQALLDLEGVLIWGELADGRALALIDAPDVNACAERLGERASQMGPFVMDPWHGSGELMKLPEMRAKVAAR